MFPYFVTLLDHQKVKILKPKRCDAATVRFYGKNDFYPNNFARQWLLSTDDPYERVKVELKLFDDSLAQGDFLEFRDGDNENALLIRRFDENKRNLDETLLNSEGKFMYVDFRSDKELTGAGFEITYYSEESSPSKGKRLTYNELYYISIDKFLY